MRWTPCAAANPAAALAEPGAVGHSMHNLFESSLFDL